MLFKKEVPPVPPHPRPDPRYPMALLPENVERIFGGCADFSKRELNVWGDPDRRLILFSIDGMAKGEKLSGDLLRPLTEAPALEPALCPEEIAERILCGSVYSAAVKRITTLDQAAESLTGGSAVLFFPDVPFAVACAARTEERRAISPPESEKTLKGARDSFIEEIRVNTSLIRRRVKTPELRVEEELVGRQTMTAVNLVYIRGIANPETVEEVRRRLREIDIDGLVTAGGLEEYLSDNRRTAFPMLVVTERPDKFCSDLLGGRVGLLVDGLPIGYLLPVALPQFIKGAQDRAGNYALASLLTMLRYVSAFAALMLPGFYTALATFHQEMIPTRLAMSIIASEQDVPLTTAAEVLVMLLAFEILQEAGLHLPQNIGQAVSIIGGLVVGQAAVEAKISSPVVVIVVAVAGITSYTMPNQDFAGALRIWRFLMTLAAAGLGLFGMMAVGAALLYHLASLESFGIPYLEPFAGRPRGPGEASPLVRRRMPMVKMRERSLNPQNKRSRR